MRVPILSACCAALMLAALPAAAHGWSSIEQDEGGASARHCPIGQPHSVMHHHVYGGFHHHARFGGGCPAFAEPGRYHYQRVFTPNQHDWSYEEPESWRRDRRSWSDGDWSGRMAERGWPGCRDANGPEAYRDGYGGHRAAPDFGMRCHDGGMRHDEGYARSGGVFGYSREEDSQWSSAERHGGWDDERDESAERPSMTDRYGFLTWPGKTHFRHGRPISEAPDIGPQAPPEESWEVHP